MTMRSHRLVVSTSFYLMERAREEKRRVRERKNLEAFQMQRHFYRVLELMAPKRFKRPFTSIQVFDDIGKHYGITMVRS
jgi:hypothetical protein